MKTNPNDPIEWREFIKSQTSFDGTVYEGRFPGLSKREYFAAIAMQGILSGVTGNSANLTTWVSCAVECADALISELNK